MKAKKMAYLNDPILSKKVRELTIAKKVAEVEIEKAAHNGDVERFLSLRKENEIRTHKITCLKQEVKGNGLEERSIPKNL